MGKRKRSHKNETPTASLTANSVDIPDEEFNDYNTFEELTSFKYMGKTKDNKVVFQDWVKEGLQTKQQNVKVLNIENELTLKDSDGYPINKNLDRLQDNDTKPSKKRKKNIKNEQKASYDKTSEEVSTISSKAVVKDKMNPEYMKFKKVQEPVDVSAWNELKVPDSIKKALSEIGYSTPTAIQEKCIKPAIMDRCDVLGAAETGSGKTLAFCIPIIHGICKDKEKVKAKIQKNKIVIQMRDKTKLKKEMTANTLKEDNDDSSDNDSFLETDEEDVEEYLFNGNDGIAEISYDTLANGEKDVAEENMDDSDEENMDDSDEENLDEEDMENLDEEDMENLDEEGMENLDEEGMENLDEEDEENSDIEDEENSDIEDEENLDQGDEENSDLEDEENSSIGSDSDFGTDDEQDIENEMDDDSKLGLTRVMNDVQFPFLKKKVKLEETEEMSLLRALILTPTRELAVQIHSHLSQVSKYSGVKTGVIVGGMDARKQKRLLKRTRPEIVVATPGRLWELIKEGVDHLQELSAVRYLAIDEADRMIDPKNFEEVDRIVKLLNGGTQKNTSGTDRQTFIFSATLTLVHQLPQRLKMKQKKSIVSTSEIKLQKLAKMVGCKPSAKIFDITRKTATAENLTECRINCEQHEKDYYLYYFLVRHPGRTMVFCNSIECVRRLKSVFTTLNYKPQDLHASMHQKQRLRHLEKFSSEPNSLLITTDVAARGLDIKGVQHVIHFQVPFTAESYVHRSGRTARANENGISIVFIEPKDVMKFRTICHTLNRKDPSEIPFFPIEENTYDQIVERVDLAVQLEKMEHVSRREEREKEDKDKAGKEIGIVDSDDELDQEDLYLLSPDKQVTMRPGAKKKEIKRLRRTLEGLIAKPIVGAMFSRSHVRNMSSIASAVGIDKNNLPDSWGAVNPKSSLVEDSTKTQREKFAEELFGEDMPFEEGIVKLDSYDKYKKQRKEMAKFTKLLLKPEKTIKDDMKKMKETMMKKNKEKAAKKREKRKKKRMRMKQN